MTNDDNEISELSNVISQIFIANVEKTKLAERFNTFRRDAKRERKECGSEDIAHTGDGAVNYNDGNEWEEWKMMPLPLTRELRKPRPLKEAQQLITPPGGISGAIE